MENQIKNSRIAGMIIGLGIMITAFFTYSLRDALIIVLIFNTIIYLSALFLSFIPILGIIIYWYFIKEIIIPVFFLSWFPDLTYCWYINMLFLIGLITSIANTILWLFHVKSVPDENRYKNFSDSQTHY